MAQRAVVFRRLRYGRKIRRFDTGFTLYELLMTLGIAGTLAATVPTMRSAILDTTLSTAVNQFRTDLAIMRSEALRRSHTVTLCKSRSGKGCEPRAEWHQGWIIFADPNGNGQLDGDEALIRVQSGLAPGFTLSFSAALGADDDLSYHANGTSAKNGTFTFCDSRGPANARAIVLNFFGRPYISKRKPSGEPLECPSSAAS
jgi:type IV fimbrial biogenesis protein FimT